MRISGGSGMKLPETIRAAFVIARATYTATVLSKTFLLFLLGPLFPICAGMGMVGIGAQVDRTPRNRRGGDFVQCRTISGSRRARPACTARSADPIVELRHVKPEADLEHSARDYWTRRKSGHARARRRFRPPETDRCGHEPRTARPGSQSDRRRGSADGRQPPMLSLPVAGSDDRTSGLKAFREA
jgi:hypothetical protein